MLYLRQSADSIGQSPADLVPLAELTAIGLERAVLAADLATRRHELITALARDPAVSAWAMRTAERRLGRAAGTIDDAVAWLAGCLEIELAGALTSDATAHQQAATGTAGVDWRLPTLVKRLAEVQSRLATFDARLEHEKLEAMKELAYGASHEINNPLANIAARAQTLMHDEADPERQRKLTAIHRQAMRAHEMIADLMLFARPPKLKPAPCDLRHVAEQVVNDLRDLANEQQTDLAYDEGSESIVLLADATQIAVALHAVVRNALEAVDDGGLVEVVVRQTGQGGEAWAEVSVRDNGPGISDEVRRHLFDPFFSGREAGRGLGFGLSKCWRIVTDHGGQVIVSRSARGGAEIAIRLPMTARTTSAHAE